MSVNKIVMKILKEDIRNRIVTAARNEFIKNGFRKTSMRTISAKSGVVLGNIYNYFKTKDDIFYAVLRPLLAVLDGRLSSYRIEPNKIDKLRFSIQSQKDLLRETLKIIFLYKEELKLLLFESKDTSLEVFRENFIDEQVAISKEYIDHMQKVYPQLQTNVSPLFFRISSFIWVTIIEEIVSNAEIGKEEAKQTLSEYIRYNTTGWQALINQ